MEHQQPILYVNKRYDGWDNFHEDFEKYKNEVKQDFTKRHSLKFEDDNPLIFKQIKYNCVYGEVRQSQATGKRTSSTLKKNCGAFIYLSVDSRTNEVVLRKLNDKHENHEGLEEYRDELAINRRLNNAEQGKVQQYYAMGCNKPGIREKIQRKTNKKIYRKDIDNIVKKLRKTDDDSLKAALKLLHEEGADVSVLRSNNIFQALYFVTDVMIQDMKASPEIVFTDGTYKLFKRKFVLQLFAVQDKFGETQFVGIGILANETLSTVNWLFEQFRQSHGAISDDIHTFMTDKDLVERLVINKIFPNAKTILCKFHTKKTFKLNVTMKKMDISYPMVKKYLDLLDEMCESTTEEKYNMVYAKFCDAAAGNKKLLDYFNTNWHCIRLQWTTFGMNQVVNLGNHTNNRVESNNSKIKKPEWMKPNDTMTSALKNLLKWLVYRKDHQRSRRTNEIIKVDAKKLDDNQVLQEYKNNLTPFAFKKAEYGIKNFLSVKLLIINSFLKKCKVNDKKDGAIYVTPVECGCSQWVASLLICKHILAVRHLFDLPLFLKTLCTRWHRLDISEKKQVKDVIAPKFKLHHGPEINKMSELEKVSDLRWTLKVLLFMVLKSKKEKFQKRYLILKSIADKIQSENNDEEEGLTAGKITTKSLEKLIKKLDRKITRLPTNEFKCELSRLKTIESLWTRNETVPTEVLQLATSGIEDSFANLSLEEEKVNISSIILPPQSKQVGRQKLIHTRCTPIKIKRKRINNK